MSLERILIPWAIARPAAFPEILSASFFFSDILIEDTILLDYLRIHNVFASQTHNSGVGGHALSPIFSEFSKRGVTDAVCLTSIGMYPNVCTNDKYQEFKSSGYIHSKKAIRVAIKRLLGSSSSTATKRCLLERTLRDMVFFWRNYFPELGSSNLVRTWEGTTGLKWNTNNDHQ